MNSFEAQVSTALGSLKGEGAPSPVYLAAVSGGADSTAMLAALSALAVLSALAALSKDAPFTLCCVHVEHGIRAAAESQGDALAVKALCEKLGVPFKLIPIPSGKIASFAASSGSGIEAAARFFRMRALRREAKRVGADRVLIAHTRDDLLETLLMRILRGSGPAGLAPMPKERGRILRPLLDLSRQDVLNYLKEKGIPYRTDSTNADTRFLRNRVRHKLVPVLDAFFPSWRQSLLALAETQSLTAAFLASEAAKRCNWEPTPQGLRLREDDFLNAPLILREESIFAAVDRLASASRGVPKTPRRSVVRKAAALESSLEDLGPVRLCRRKGWMEMTPSKPHFSTEGLAGEKGFSLLIKEAGFYILKGRVLGLEISDLCIRAGVENLTSGVPVFSAALPLVLRKHEGGDRIFIRGHKRCFSDIIDTKARSEYTGIITAEDSEGPAAFICCKGSGALMVFGRQDNDSEASLFFEINFSRVQ